jgi:hypothetical protein
MDKGQVTALILLDLSSAFDMVDHGLLHLALERVGISGIALQWLQSYLSGRSQSILIDGTSSAPVSISTGVPQGSVLGPLIFTIYMLGIGDVIRAHGFNYVVYADDVQIFGSFPPDQAATVADRFQLCVDDISKWFARKRLILNCAKSELILLGTGPQLKKVNEFPIVLQDQQLKVRDSVRDLGFTLDKNVRLDCQVAKVAQSSFAHLRMLHCVSRYLSAQHRLLLVHSLVISHMNFSTSLYFGISKKLAARLQRIINSALRVAMTIKGAHHITPILQQQGILLMQPRIEARIATIVHQALRGRGPSSIRSMLQSSTNPRDLRSCVQNLLVVPRSRTCCGERAFSICAPRVWNSIPLTIREEDDSVRFAEKLHQHFLFKL